MHAPIPAVFSLFVLPLSFFLSILSFFLVSYYSLAMGCSPFLVFPFFGYLSLGAYYSLIMGFPPLSASLHWVSLFQCFFLFPCFILHYSPSVPPFFLPWLPSFYSKLIQWDFSLLPLGFHQLFLVCCEHPFKIPLTHWLPLLLLSTCLLQRYSFHDKIPFCLFLLYTSTSRWLNKDWATSLPSSMACIRWFPYITSFG